MKKILLISSIILSVCLFLVLGKQVVKVYNSISIWNDFQGYVSSGKQIQDCPIVKKGSNFINFDVVRINSTKIDIRRTIQAHILDGNKKVVLDNGYVDIEDGQIIHLKFL